MKQVSEQQLAMAPLSIIRSPGLRVFHSLRLEYPTTSGGASKVALSYILFCECGPFRGIGIFPAVADPTRRRILERLHQQELTVLEIWEPFRITQPSLSKHLAVLRGSGLVAVRRSGRYRYYRLNPKPFEQIATWAAKFQDFRDP